MPRRPTPTIAGRGVGGVLHDAEPRPARSRCEPDLERRPLDAQEQRSPAASSRLKRQATHDGCRCRSARARPRRSRELVRAAACTRRSRQCRAAAGGHRGGSGCPCPGGSRAAQTSVSGPYWLVLRQAVQVVVFEQASWFELTFRPVSPEPMMPFDQRPASESGFSLARLKLSRAGSGSPAGRARRASPRPRSSAGPRRSRSRRTPCSSRSSRW